MQYLVGSSILVHASHMEGSRKLESVMLGIMAGKGRHGRPDREWILDTG